MRIATALRPRNDSREALCSAGNLPAISRAAPVGAASGRPQSAPADGMQNAKK